VKRRQERAKPPASPPAPAPASPPVVEHDGVLGLGDPPGSDSTFAEWMEEHEPGEEAPSGPPLRRRSDPGPSSAGG
jgi:hypothetical protein